MSLLFCKSLGRAAGATNEIDQPTVIVAQDANGVNPKRIVCNALNLLLFIRRSRR